MADLETQLAAYFDDVVDRVDVADLAPPAPRGAEPAAPVDVDGLGPDTERERRSPGVLLAAAAILIGAVVLVGLWVTAADDGDTDVVTEPTASTAPPETPVTLAPPPIAGAGFTELPALGVADAHAVRSEAGVTWVENGTTTLYRIDPAAGEIDDRAELELPAVDLDQGAGSVWAAHARGFVTEVDAATGEVLGTFRVPGRADRVAYGADGVWVADLQRGTVTHLDAADGRIVHVVADAGPIRGRIEATDRGVYLVRSDGSVTAIDPITHEVEEIELDVEVQSLAVDAAGGVWVGVPPRAEVVRIDGATPRPVAVEGQPRGVSAGERYVWAAVASDCDGDDCAVRVVAIDPTTHREDHHFDLDRRPMHRGLWVGDDAVYLVEADRTMTPIHVEGGT